MKVFFLYVLIGSESIKLIAVIQIRMEVYIL
jgi:hypothetical protein